MFKIPITDVSLPFAAPLGAEGTLQLKVSEDVLSLLEANQAFPRTAAFGPGKLIDIALDLQGGGKLRLGPVDDVALSVGAAGQASLDIVWPEEDPAPLAPYDLTVPSDKLYLILSCSGEAEVGAQARLPAAGSAALGLKTGANTKLVYLRPFRQSEPARQIIQDFFKHVRLPYDVRGAADLPEPGEVIAFEYGGYLALQAEATWGYTLQRYVEASVGDLRLVQKIDLASALRLKLGGSIAGQYAIELRRASGAGAWARVVVRKQRQAALTVAADLGIGVTLDEEGLPEDADAFLSSLLGLSLVQQVEQVTAALAQGPDAVLGWLHQKANALTDRLLRDLFAQWRPGEVFEQKLAPFLDDVRQVLDRYEALRKEDERLLQLAAEYTVGRLGDTMVLLLALAGRGDLTKVQETAFWGIVRKLLGDRYFDFLTDDEAFEQLRAEVVQKIRRLLDTGLQRLLDLTGAAKALARLDQVAATLRAFDTPQELQAQAERHVLLLAERLTGRAFDELADTDALRQALADLQQAVGKLDALKRELYGQFRQALNQSYKVSLSRAYARTSERQALVDVEIDLAAAQGPALLQQALHGNFAGVLQAAPGNPSVRLREGAFTHRRGTTNQLNVSLFGWEYSRFHELVVNEREVVVPRGDGLFHVYELTAQETDRRRRRGEEIQLSFTAGLLAEGALARDRRPDLVDSVSRLTADYGFSIQDARTTDRELESYLDLAKHLGLLPVASPADYARALRTQLGLDARTPLGAVAVVYQVAYEPDVLLNVFRFLKEPSIRAITKRAFRRVVSATYAGYGAAGTTTAERSALALSRAIQLDAMHEAWRTQGLKEDRDGAFTFTLTGTGAGRVELTLTRLHRQALSALYGAEEAFTEALLDLDRVLDRVEQQQQPNRNEVRRAFERVVRQREEVERFMAPDERSRFVSPFFAILDDFISTLQAARLLPEDARRSTMELTLRQSDRSLTQVLVG